MTTHALIAPSSAESIVACPARVVIGQGVGGYMDGDTRIRDEGTACHWVAEQYALSTHTPEAGTLAPNGVEVDASMQYAAHKWVEHLQSWGIQPSIEDSQLPVPQVPRCFGTPDAWGVQGCHLYVSDLKYGYRAVQVWPNLQLACYAAAAAHKAGLALDSTTVVHLAIYQPRAYHRAGYLRTAIVTGADIAKALQPLTRAAYLALQPEPPALPGQHCTHCPGRARCPALRDAAMLEIAPNASPDPLPFADAERELKYLQAKQRMLDAYVSGLALEVEHAMRNGQHAQHFELRRSVGALEWKAGVEAEVQRIAGLMGQDVSAPAKLITPTQARAKLGNVVYVYATRGAASVKLAPIINASDLF